MCAANIAKATRIEFVFLNYYPAPKNNNITIPPPGPLPRPINDLLDNFIKPSNPPDPSTLPPPNILPQDLNSGSFKTNPIVSTAPTPPSVPSVPPNLLPAILPLNPDQREVLSVPPLSEASITSAVESSSDDETIEIPLPPSPPPPKLMSIISKSQNDKNNSSTDNKDSVLSQIKEGVKLKKVDPSSTQPAPASNNRNPSAATIRQGRERLKKLDKKEIEKQRQENLKKNDGTPLSRSIKAFDTKTLKKVPQKEVEEEEKDIITSILDDGLSRMRRVLYPNDDGSEEDDSFDDDSDWTAAKMQWGSLAPATVGLKNVLIINKI